MHKSLIAKFNKKAKATVVAAAIAVSAFFGSTLQAQTKSAPEKKADKPKITKTFNNTIGFSYTPVATWHWEFINNDKELVTPHRVDTLNERHHFGGIRLKTENYGNWGLFTLLPNSQNDNSFGFAYIHDLYTWHFYKGAKVDLSGALGIATGYNESIVPFAAVELTLTVPMTERTNLTIDTGVAPYFQGVVFRSPVVGAQYKF